MKNALKPIDMPLYRYRDALLLSLYSKQLYVDVAKRWKGLGLTYYLLLLMVAVAPFSIYSMIQLNHRLGADLLTPIAKTPNIHIEHGRVIFKKKMPYLIENDKKEAIVIVDTTGQVKHITAQYPKLMLLITKQAYFFKAPSLLELSKGFRGKIPSESYDITRYSLKKIKHGVFNAANWLKKSNLITIKNVLIVLIYPFVLFLFFGFLTPLLVVLAMLGQVFSVILLKHPLKFMPACRLMMVASSIGVFMFFSLKIIDICSNQSKLFCMALIFVYFCYGVLAVKQASRQVVLQ